MGYTGDHNLSENYQFYLGIHRWSKFNWKLSILPWDT